MGARKRQVCAKRSKQSRLGTAVPGESAHKVGPWLADSWLLALLESVPRLTGRLTVPRQLVRCGFNWTSAFFPGVWNLGT